MLRLRWHNKMVDLAADMFACIYCIRPGCLGATLYHRKVRTGVDDALKAMAEVHGWLWWDLARRHCCPMALLGQFPAHLHASEASLTFFARSFSLYTRCCTREVFILASI